MRYQFIDRVKKAYPITLLCKVMRVSRSGYYAWRDGDESIMHMANMRLLPRVRAIHRESGGTYGTRRLAKELQAVGIPCGRARARTLMNLTGVTVKQRSKFKATTDSKHNMPVAPNLLNRQFEVTEPNRVWVSDITYIWTSKGWLYLAMILDLFNRLVVGWSMNNRITRQLVMDALRMGLWRRGPSPGLIFHSDRGSQYCSDDFQSILKTNDMLSSMGRKSDCWDNAVVESFFGTLETERVFFSNYKTREEARGDIVDYIEMFYNSKRRHSYLDYVSPKEFEINWLLKNVA